MLLPVALLTPKCMLPFITSTEVIFWVTTLTFQDYIPMSQGQGSIFPTSKWWNTNSKWQWRSMLHSKSLKALLRMMMATWSCISPNNVRGMAQLVGQIVFDLKLSGSIPAKNLTSNCWVWLIHFSLSHMVLPGLQGKVGGPLQRAVCRLTRQLDFPLLTLTVTFCKWWLGTHLC